jgi:hydroxyethylthiazole kinase-like uncharacterized protein yjeF
MKIVTASEMLRIEEECSGLGISPSQLMERAGLAVAENVRRISGDVCGKRITVLAGPGNNGGDGMVAARYLQGWGAVVSLYLCQERQADDINYKQALECGITLFSAEKDPNLAELEKALKASDMIIDAVFGTGQNRTIAGIYQRVLFKLSEIKKKNSKPKILAVDLPSGLNADNGAVDPATPYADYTVTLGLPKRGLFTPSGGERAGKIITADIGIPASLHEGLKTELMADDLALSLLPRRSAFAHKGSFGKALVVAGSQNYIGAAYLAASGAMRVGSGLVTLAIARSLQPMVATKLMEATYLPLPENEPCVISGMSSGMVLGALKEYDALLMGCGLGQSPPVKEFFTRTILAMNNMRIKTVIDADGLNLLSQIPEWWQRITFDAILTPHPGEMARLCGLTIDEVQSNRIDLTVRKAAEWHKTVVLKGACTVIAAPDGRCNISSFANAGLASAGTGDVLAGVIVGLLAQGLDLFDAAALGVFLHARAGERVKQNLGDAGMIASDLLPELPQAIKQLKGV